MISARSNLNDDFRLSPFSLIVSCRWKTEVLLAYIYYFEKMKAGLWDLLAANVFMYPPNTISMPEPIFMKLGTYVINLSVYQRRNSWIHPISLCVFISIHYRCHVTAQ
jgi:hypothetical protein